MKTPPAAAATTEYIRVGDLEVIWPNAQRAPVARHIRAIAENLDPDLLGVIAVGKTANGRYHICDGQHRVAAVRLRYGENERVLCNVKPMNTAAEAARAFRGLNVHRKTTAMSDFLCAVTEGAPRETEIFEALRAIGVSVSGNSGPANVQSAETLLGLYRDGGCSHVADVVLTLIRAWVQHTDALDARLLRGMSLVLRKHAHTIDRGLFVEKLAKATAPGALIGRARSYASATRCKIPVAVACQLIDIYNARKRDNFLSKEGL